MRIEGAGPLKGRISIPGDKSISHRAALLGALADGVLEIENYAPGADCQSTLNCLRELGVSLRREADRVRVVGRKGRLCEPTRVLDCENSGTTLRLLLGVLAGQPIHSTLTGDDSLTRRPMRRVVTPLAEMGATIRGRMEHTRAPLAVTGGGLRGIDYRAPVASAQVKSAVLLAGLAAKGPVRFFEPHLSRDHTERMLAEFGVPVTRAGTTVSLEGSLGDLKAPDAGLKVPGDISSAAFLMAAALLVPDSELVLENVGLNPSRTGMLRALERAGARVECRNHRQWGGEPVGDLVMMHSKLRPFTIGPEEVPALIDELPVLALLASRADGVSEFRGVGELRVKETDRLAAIIEELGKSGVALWAEDDVLIVRGESQPRSNTLDGRGDHRMAMCLALSGLPDTPMRIQGGEAIRVSYPGFTADLERLGVRMWVPPARQVVGLIGHPVGHSRSPAMMTAAFKARNLDWDYVAFDVRPEGLSDALRGLRALGMAGVNVTIPHKERVLGYLARVEDLAGAVGAVNVIVNEKDGLVGYNTDAEGVRKTLKANGFDPKGKRVLLVGAGGAARAAAFALAQDGVGMLHIANRGVKRARRLAEDLRDVFSDLSVATGELEKAPSDVDLIVQATPVGMHPHEGDCPLPEEYLIRAKMTVFDMIYSPRWTTLLQRAHQQGARVISGVDMLAYQGARAFELWTGETAPLAAMFAALGGR